MKNMILTGILGLAVAAQALAVQSGISTIYTPLIDLDTIVYIEEEKPVELGFDTAMYLPENFDAYTHPNNFMDISYIEEESEVILGFEVSAYLPADFNPYKVYFDLDSIEYIEEEEEIEFDFEIHEYLPADFKPVSTY